MQYIEKPSLKHTLNTMKTGTKSHGLSIKTTKPNLLSVKVENVALGVMVVAIIQTISKSGGDTK